MSEHSVTVEEHAGCNWSAAPFVSAPGDVREQISIGDIYDRFDSGQIVNTRTGVILKPAAVRVHPVSIESLPVARIGSL